MNIWQLVEHDHANIAYLIREIPRAAEGHAVVRSRGRLLGDLLSELEAHARALDASVLAPLEHRDEGRQLVSDLRREHGRIMARLNDLAGGASDGGEAWLNAFADVAYAVDQHLHRHGHELAPAARAVLPADVLDRAAHAFVRAKANLLRASRGRPVRAPQPRELFLISAVGVATAALALIAWGTGLFGTPQSREALAREKAARARTAHADARGRADLAAAAAPGERAAGDDLGERQDRLLDEAFEETFPGSDPISPKQITT